MKIILFFMPLLLLAFSCKKEQVTAPTSTTTTSNPNDIYGVLEASKALTLFFYSNDSLVGFGSNTKLATATFSSQVFVNNGFIYGTSVAAGTVSLNGTPLKQLTNPIYYNDTTYSIPFPIQTWSVTGDGSVPAINYTNNDSVPVFTGYASFPDTIYKSQGFTIPINNLSGCDDIRLYMSNSSANILKNYSSSITSISISPSELANFSTGNIVFQLNFSKNNNQVFNNKTYRFKTSLLVQVTNMILIP